MAGDVIHGTQFATRSDWKVAAGRGVPRTPSVYASGGRYLRGKNESAPLLSGLQPDHLSVNAGQSNLTSSSHDDLVLALALAVFGLSRPAYATAND